MTQPALVAEDHRLDPVPQVQLGQDPADMRLDRALGQVQLPAGAAAGIGRTGGMLATAPTAELTTVSLYRSDRIPGYRGGGLAVRAGDPALPSTLDGRLSRGTFLNPATAGYRRAAGSRGVTSTPYRYRYRHRPIR